VHSESICLLGAECTGKSSLTQALAEALPATPVFEYLREWCLREARTPRREEQAAIAAEQQRRIDVALATSGGHPGWVVADTSPLMTALYSRHYFADDSLFEPALRLQRQHRLTLLCSPEGIAWQADGCLREGDAVRRQTHAELQRLLDAEQLPYRLLEGSVEARLQQVLALLRTQSSP
jgi:nicotinamide riboside kinase